jgi:hypothetical protein
LLTTKKFRVCAPSLLAYSTGSKQFCFVDISPLNGGY